MVQYGLIGGGLADGSICIWNPAKIVGPRREGEDPKSALLCRLQKHSGAVRPPEHTGGRFAYCAYEILHKLTDTSAQSESSDLLCGSAVRSTMRSMRLYYTGPEQLLTLRVL